MMQVKRVVIVEVVIRAVQSVDKRLLCTDQLYYRIWKSPRSECGTVSSRAPSARPSLGNRGMGPLGSRSDAMRS